MAQNQTVRIQKPALSADESAYWAVKAMSDYQPANSAFAAATLTTSYDGMRAAQEAELHAQNALAAARDAVVSAEWDFHNLVLGAKDQVVALYGSDSDQVQALGRKKKSERARPARKSA
jgi:hypothetical protein